MDTHPTRKPEVRSQAIQDLTKLGISIGPCGLDRLSADELARLAKQVRAAVNRAWARGYHAAQDFIPSRQE